MSETNGTSEISELGSEEYFREKYADLEDELFVTSASGGGGGKKKKTAPRDRKSETAKAKKQETIEASEENRREDAEENLQRVFEDFPHFDNEQKADRFLEMYTSWVNASLASGAPLIEKGGLEEEFMRSGKKAGGQNVNKVSSAVRLKHIPTNISVRNEETRDQAKNRESARSGLQDRLRKHLEDWKTYLGKGKNEITKSAVQEIIT